MAVGGYIGLGLWLAYGFDGYQIAGAYVTDGPSNPLHFEVTKGGSWMQAYALRGTWFYRRLAFGLGSAAIALVAAVWLIERAFDLKLL